MSPFFRLAPGVLPDYAPERVLRFVRGPQAGAFPREALAAFASETFTVSTRSDRVGVRLGGPAVALDGAADVAPEGVVTGSVQVPGDGRPIVLGVDRPTTGGYAKIATVITVDLGFIAQAKPGDRVRFAEVDVEEARRAWRESEERLRSGMETMP